MNELEDKSELLKGVLPCVRGFESNTGILYRHLRLNDATPCELKRINNLFHYIVVSNFRTAKLSLYETRDKLIAKYGDWKQVPWDVQEPWVYSFAVLKELKKKWYAKNIKWISGVNMKVTELGEFVPKTPDQKPKSCQYQDCQTQATHKVIYYGKQFGRGMIRYRCEQHSKQEAYYSRHEQFFFKNDLQEVVEPGIIQ